MITSRQLASPRNTLRRDTFRFYLKVTMGHLATLERMRSFCGVGIIVKHVDRKALRGKVNSSWSYIVAPRQAQALLTRVRPYLFTLAEQADLALDFLRLENAPLGGSHGSAPVPDVLFEKRLLAYWRLRQMKPRWRFYKAEIDRKAKRLGVTPEYQGYLSEKP